MGVPGDGRGGTRLFGLRLDITPHPVPVDNGNASGGLLVFARRAGPGDSLLLIETLMTLVGYRPRIVLKKVLRLDPCLDVLLGTLPTCFVPAGHGRDEVVAGIGRLAADLGDRDALVIFPEGGKFTQGRRARAVRWLRRHGEVRRAAYASRSRHVLPPMTAGPLAAMAAAPRADIVFVAHTGLDAMDSVGAVWRGLPLRHPVRARWWRIPAAELPVGPEARTDWLLAQWAEVDAWVRDNREL
ncbi:hypothetical protein ACIGXM_11765 [Kitasatospora sp. NPDC052896]|uniref:hypothetical protein n=1 Tax=Kitasatospora sp. NPDC052896 TaxID=3364061 RepID=UPI0037C72704